MSLCKVTLIGNVGRDPEMRYLPNENPVTSFSVATNRKYTVDGEQREETQWFNVSAWNRLAEACNRYVVKGMKVYVEGRLSLREWVGQDGQARTSLDVTAFEVQFLDRPDESGAGQSGARRNGGVVETVPTTPTASEEIPW